MTDIIIYTTKEQLLHKQGKLKDDPDYSELGEYYWRLHNMPKRIDYGFKIYFAVKGFIIGYFMIEDFDRDSILFNCNSWKGINPIPTKAFQGFKYADKVKELRRLKDCPFCGGEINQVREAFFKCLNCKQNIIADEEDLRRVIE